MEYVPGSPITHFADRHGLSIRARLELFLQVCEGVEHAHQKGLLHRDLKPGNILVASQDGRSVVKIIDFGIAKAIGPGVTAGIVETQIGVLLGTPEYMSPEQASLTPEGVDTRTDIYSLGMVLYELLAGALPFDVDTLRQRPVIEMLRVIREDEPPRLTVRLTGQSETALQEIAQRRLVQPRALVRQLRGDLEWITGRALEKEPARRYPSASELRADVQRHLSNEVVQAGPPSIAHRVHKFARRHRGIAAISIALAATIVAAAILSTVLWIRSERARRDTRRQLVATLVAGGVARLDAWDWAGGLLSFVKALELEPDRAREREHRVRIGQVLQRMPRLVRLWPHGLRVKSVSVSTQGIVASAGTDGMVRLWSIQTGRQIGEPLRHDGAVNHVVFSPDGTWLASASGDGTARIWRAADGEPVGQPLRHEKGVADVAFSPDSLVIATAGADGWARLWRIGSDTPFVQIDLGAPLLRVVFTRDGSRFAAAATARTLNHSRCACGLPRMARPLETGFVGSPAGRWTTWISRPTERTWSPGDIWAATACASGTRPLARRSAICSCTATRSRRRASTPPAPWSSAPDTIAWSRSGRCPPGSALRHPGRSAGGLNRSGSRPMGNCWRRRLMEVWNWCFPARAPPTRPAGCFQRSRTRAR